MVRVLNGLDGIQDVNVSVGDKTVTVEFDENKVSIPKMKNAIEDIGYDVE